MNKSNTKKNNVYCIILAAGDGERLWPISNPEKPKQFLKFIENKTLLEQTFQRAKLLSSNKNIWITSLKKYEHFFKNFKTCNVILNVKKYSLTTNIESICAKIFNLNPNAILVFLPSDLYISKNKNKNFKKDIEETFNKLNEINNKAFILCSKPTSPLTSNSYIKVKENSNGDLYIKKFIAKPSFNDSLKYMNLNDLYWNTGIFIGKASTLIKFINKKKINTDKTINESTNIKKDYSFFDNNIKNFMAKPIDFVWDDIGDIDNYLKLKKQNMPASKTTLIEINCMNNLIDTNKKLVTLINVDNLRIIETENELLITKYDSDQENKNLFKSIQKKLKA